MVKLSQKHIDAICHAELFFDPIFAKLESSRLRKHLEDDLLSLTELKLYIHESMSQGAKLPFIDDGKDR